MSFQSKSFVLAATCALFLVSVTDAFSATYERAVTTHWRFGRTGVPLSSWKYPGKPNILDSGYPMWYNGYMSIPFGQVQMSPIIEDLGLGSHNYGCIWNYSIALPGVWYVPFNIRGLTAEETIGVTVTLTNNPPVAYNFSTTAAGSGASNLMINLLANAADSNGDPITVNSLTQPTPAGCASVVWNSQTNLAEFTPSNDSVGLCQFTYTVTDIASVSAPGKVSITVTN